MTETRQPTLSADAIINLRDEMTALPMLLSGVLDAKIAEFKAEQDKAKKATDAATAKMQEADARDRETAAAKAKLDDERRQIDADKKINADNAAALRTSLDAKAKAISDQTTDLAAREAKLKTDQAAFNKRLEALKVAV